MKPVTVRFKLTQAEFAEGLRAIMQRQLTFWVGPILGAVTLFYGFLIDDTVARVWGTIVLLLAIASIAAVPGLRWRQSQKLAGEQQHTFSEERITVRAAGQQGDLPWDFYARVVETPRVYVLMRNRKQGNFVPRRAFASPDDEERFRTLVTGKGLKLR